MDTQTKKEWQKPQIIILVRSNPEEAVLTACKNSDFSGPTDMDGLCTQLPNCDICSVYTSS